MSGLLLVFVIANNEVGATALPATANVSIVCGVFQTMLALLLQTVDFLMHVSNVLTLV